ncbi:hypothetical protein A9Q90_06850 [Gammaproteobacteria bacterium 54_18_T64]|nr:hypothetical protein A9Q90_06850 [Gammaproteobacteria bacterium 54_18_T64]
MRGDNKLRHRTVPFKLIVTCGPNAAVSRLDGRDKMPLFAKLLLGLKLQSLTQGLEVEDQ